MGEAGPDDALAALRAASDALEQARGDLDDAARAAHASGLSWAAVGAALGITRQAAFKRFGRPRDPRTGAPMTPTPTADLLDLTERLFAALDAGRADELRAAMPDDVARVLTREVLLDTWARAVAETGHLRGCRDTRLELPGGEPLDPDQPVLGTVVGRTTLVCEAGEWQGRAALDAERRLLGLLVLAPDGPDVAF